MFRDIFTNRLFIGALAIFIFCVGGSLLYMQHIDQHSAREERPKQLTEQENRPPTKAVSSVASQNEQGHLHEDGTFHAEPHDAPVVEVSESEVSADVLAAPVVPQSADTESDAATLELAERRLKDPEVSKAWVEWSEKVRELREESVQAGREILAAMPSTDEEQERFDNSPEMQRKLNEAFHKAAKIDAMLRAHEAENPLFQ